MLGEATGLVRWVAIITGGGSIKYFDFSRSCAEEGWEDGTLEDADHYLPGAVDAHAVDVREWRLTLYDSVG